MVPIPEITVDLRLPAATRWQSLEPFRRQACELLDFYVRDISGTDTFGDQLLAYRDAFVSPEYSAEMSAIAALLERSEAEVLLSNLYYDALKHVFGCTAFCIATDGGNLHARNLDWWTERGILSEHTLLIRFVRGRELVFTAVSWPGFIGALSGVAPGRLSITLNAVLSDEPAGLAPPVTLLIRQVLESEAAFADAVRVLAETEVASDSLLMVAGTRDDERVVIERTPTRAATRDPDGNILCATNGYRTKQFEGSGDGASGVLQSTSCDRYDRATERVASAPPIDAGACFDILSDPRIRMDMTVQQMVLCPTTGDVQVRLPARS